VVCIEPYLILAFAFIDSGAKSLTNWQYNFKLLLSLLSEQSMRSNRQLLAAVLLAKNQPILFPCSRVGITQGTRNSWSFGSEALASPESCEAKASLPFYKLFRGFFNPITLPPIPSLF